MKKFIRIFLLGTLLLLMQSCGWESSVKKGDQSWALGEYFDAANHYKKAYATLPSKDKKKRGEIAYKMANSYRLINYTSRAIGGYANAIRYKYSDINALFYLAESQLKSGDYKSATKNYELFLEQKPTDALALNGLKSCTLATEWKNSPTRYIVRKSNIFNGRRCDYSPAYAGKETDQIYFTSTRDQAKGNNINGITGMKSADIFMAKKNDKKIWQQPEVIESEVNSDFEDGASSFSADGKTMYFTRCRIDATAPVCAEIFVSQRTGAAWGAPQKCVIIKDSLSSLAHPAISPTITTSISPRICQVDMEERIFGAYLFRIQVLAQ